ncbi:MAG: phenylalanine--tRNA ligase subunit beta, partial [Candidatus Omnitrophica bacterium]|nr:phenylalanine--tRNA ligase subunit beta [Candidatus Omnitrophota bacterium]
KDLESIGLRSINNIVDITNFCLFEFGQPLHAFDLDKLKGNKVVVRKAKRDESIVTIDGLKRVLDEDILVIADAERPVAIAGIMGGKDTEVTESTKNILLESAYFDPPTIRRVARKLALSSDSSYRFERDISFENVKRCSDRASLLIDKVAKGKIVSEFFDVGKKPQKEKFIVLRPSRVNKILGVNIPETFIEETLTNLGFDVLSKKDAFNIKPNYLRKDVTREIDLIGEIARLYGYGKIPSKIPKGLITTETAKENDSKKVKFARDILVSLGFNEVITYSLISTQILKNLGMEVDNTIIKIKNPLSAEQAIMRPNLICGIINTASFNLNRKESLINIFELGNIYKRQNGNYNEELYLAGALCGIIDRGWREKPRQTDLFDLKGILEELFKRLRIDVEFNKEPRQILSDNSSCGIYVKERCIGVLGELKSEYLHSFDIKERVFVFEMNFNSILKEIDLNKYFTSIPRFPSVKRDISLIIDRKISSAQIMSVIRTQSSALIKDVKLFDQYAGSQIPPDKKSLAYSIEYQANDRTLADEEVNALHLTIAKALQDKLSAQIRER